MSELAMKKCVPCEAGTPPLREDQIRPLEQKLGGWSVVENHHLHKNYSFKNFREALAFVDKIGAVAEEEDHHPDIELGWGKVGVTLFTHKIKGLSDNDFIMAAKIDRIQGN